MSLLFSKYSNVWDASVCKLSSYSKTKAFFSLGSLKALEVVIIINLPLQYLKSLFLYSTNLTTFRIKNTQKMVINGEINYSRMDFADGVIEVSGLSAFLLFILCFLFVCLAFMLLFFFQKESDSLTPSSLSSMYFFF